MNDYTITKTEGICLVILSGAPVGLPFVEAVFTALSKRDLNIDMISQSPPTGIVADLAFTVSDNDLAEVLAVIACLRGDYPQIKSTVSNGNVKLNVSGERMRHSVGVAARVFCALEQINPQITLVTTSETDISLLIQGADADTAYEALLTALQKASFLK